jgi:hypothetical protein
MAKSKGRKPKAAARRRAAFCAAANDQRATSGKDIQAERRPQIPDRTAAKIERKRPSFWRKPTTDKAGIRPSSIRECAEDQEAVRQRTKHQQRPGWDAVDA